MIKIIVLIYVNVMKIKKLKYIIKLKLILHIIFLYVLIMTNY